MYINIHFHLYFELHDHREYKIFTGIPPAAQRTVSSDSSDSFAAALIRENKKNSRRRLLEGAFSQKMRWTQKNKD